MLWASEYQTIFICSGFRWCGILSFWRIFLGIQIMDQSYVQSNGCNKFRLPLYIATQIRNPITLINSSRYKKRVTPIKIIAQQGKSVRSVNLHMLASKRVWHGKIWRWTGQLPVMGNLSRLPVCPKNWAGYGSPTIGFRWRQGAGGTDPPRNWDDSFVSSRSYLWVVVTSRSYLWVVVTFHFVRNRSDLVR